MKFKRVEEKRYKLVESSDYSFERYRAKADRMMERNYSEDFEMLKYHKWYLDFEPEYIFLYVTDYDTYVVVITGYDKSEEFDTQEEAEKYWDEFFNDDEDSELEEDIDSGYILTHCPECFAKNRVFVKFPAFNKPFEDTQYTCDKCGCKALVKDSHKYAEDGTIVEGAEDDYKKKIEEYKDKLIEVNAAIEKLLDRKRKYEESTPEVRKAMDSIADGDYLGNLKSDMADLETKQKSLMHNIEVTSEIMKNGGQLKMQDLQLTTEKLTEATSTRTISYKDTTYTVTSVPVSSLQVGDKVIVKNGRFTEGVGILDKKYYSSAVQAFILSYKMVASSWDRHTKKFTSGYEEQVSDDEYRTSEIYKVISEVKNPDELENRQAKVLVPVKPSDAEIQQYNLSVEPANKYSFTITGKYKDIRDYMTGDYGLQDKISTIEYADVSTTESYDDWEESGIYGGDLTYCPICDTRLKYDEDGDHYCPKCKENAHSLSMKRRVLDKNNRAENKSLKEAGEKEYSYSNEVMDGVKFSIYEYTSGPKAGKVQISSLHPYDDADYHWATSKDSGKTFRIYIESPGKYVETFTNDSPTYDKVMARLNELDRAKKIKPRMIHN